MFSSGKLPGNHSSINIIYQLIPFRVPVGLYPVPAYGPPPPYGGGRKYLKSMGVSCRAVVAQRGEALVPGALYFSVLLPGKGDFLANQNSCKEGRRPRCKSGGRKDADLHKKDLKKLKNWLN